MTESSFRCHELGIACGKVTSRCARAELIDCGSAPPGDEMERLPRPPVKAGIAGRACLGLGLG